MHCKYTLAKKQAFEILGRTMHMYIQHCLSFEPTLKITPILSTIKYIKLIILKGTPLWFVHVTQVGWPRLPAQNLTFYFLHLQNRLKCCISVRMGTRVVHSNVSILFIYADTVYNSKAFSPVCVLMFIQDTLHHKSWPTDITTYIF